MIGAVSMELALGEVYQAASVGILRRIESRRLNLSGGRAMNGNGWTNDIEGACAELALAKYLGVYWNGGVNTFKAGDVGKFQVRYSQYYDARLVVRTNDAPGDIYVLVVGGEGNYTLVGWCAGERAREVGSWENPNGYEYAWWVDQRDLSSMSGIWEVL